MRTKKELLNLHPRIFFNFICMLSTTDYLKMDSKDIQLVKAFVCSDGCTGVPDWYIEACILHDFWYRTHKDFDGSIITKQEADKRLRKKIQQLSPVGIFSPMSWWRWSAVKLFAKKAWEE